MDSLQHEEPEDRQSEVPDHVVSDARSLADHVASALDNAPRYVRDIFHAVHEMNERRAALGLPPLDGDGRPQRNGRRTLGQFMQED